MCSVFGANWKFKFGENIISIFGIVISYNTYREIEKFHVQTISASKFSLWLRFSRKIVNFFILITSVVTFFTFIRIDNTFFTFTQNILQNAAAISTTNEIDDYKIVFDCCGTIVELGMQVAMACRLTFILKLFGCIYQNCKLISSPIFWISKQVESV